MSKIGKLPIKLTDGVSAKIDGGKISLTGPLGNLEIELPSELLVELTDQTLLIKRKNNVKYVKALHGTYRSHIQNMNKGVSVGWSKTLELIGTGYRAELKDKDLVLSIGFSHPVVIQAPDGIKFEVQKSLIIISGIDKELVGQIAANIRAVRPPEPYKGKGIKYQGEYIRRKLGKAGKAVAS